MALTTAETFELPWPTMGIEAFLEGAHGPDAVAVLEYRKACWRVLNTWPCAASVGWAYGLPLRVEIHVSEPARLTRGDTYTYGLHSFLGLQAIVLDVLLKADIVPVNGIVRDCRVVRHRREGSGRIRVTIGPAEEDAE